MVRQWRTAAAALAVLVAFSGTLTTCGWGDDDAAQKAQKAEDDGSRAVKQQKKGRLAFSSSEATTVVRVRATKGFQFEGVPETITGPKVLFEMTAEGSHPHDLTVVRVPGGEEVGGIEPFLPGQRRRLALELPPGRYIAWCQVMLLDTPHSELGMLSRFTVV